MFIVYSHPDSLALEMSGCIAYAVIPVFYPSLSLVCMCTFWCISSSIRILPALQQPWKSAYVVVYACAMSLKSCMIVCLHPASLNRRYQHALCKAYILGNGMVYGSLNVDAPGADMGHEADVLVQRF